jgi:ornithine cyclodeaminase/alanine dehydrogenase
MKVLPLKKVWAYDCDQTQALRFATQHSAELGIEIVVVDDLQRALKQSDVCVTCTPSKRAFVGDDFIVPGTFIAAVGADNPEKQELEPALLARHKLVVDVLEQCATIGELHHALAAGVMTRGDVYGELGEVIAGTKPGRTSPEDVLIFDSTGMALQDVVTAAAVYEKACSEGFGTRIDFAQ